MDSDKVKNFISNLVNRLKVFINTVKKLVINIVNYLKYYINKKNKRVIYLIKHSKKCRIRKKNLHRLMRC